MVAKKGMPCAYLLTTSSSWLVDTGCPRVLVPTSLLKVHGDSSFTSGVSRFCGIANGQGSTNQKLFLHSPLVAPLQGCTLWAAPPPTGVDRGAGDGVGVGKGEGTTWDTASSGSEAALLAGLHQTATSLRLRLFQTYRISERLVRIPLSVSVTDMLMGATGLTQYNGVMSFHRPMSTACVSAHIFALAHSALWFLG